MKKAISLFLTLALCMGLLAGCSNSSEPVSYTHLLGRRDGVNCVPQS